MAEIAADALIDAALDTLYLVPFLFFTYLFMEWFEHRAGARTQGAMQRAGAAGPAIGALLGAIPQCGFSAAASTLYAGRVVTLGTLFAVYLSTSDEMLPIFIAAQIPWTTLAAVIGAKMAIGIVFGFVVDATMRVAKRPVREVRIHELCEQDHCHCDDEHSEAERGIAMSALIHTLQVTLFVFLISLALNLAFEVIGEEPIGAFLGANDELAVVGAAVFGLIPNCAASVAIAELFAEGVLGAGAMMAGLLSAAGIGLLVLFRSNRPVRQNLLIVCALVAISIVCGLTIDAFML